MGIRLLCIAASIILLMSFIPSTIRAQTIDGKIEEGEYPETLTADKGNYTLSWIIKGSTIYMAMSAKTEGWVSVGFDPKKVMDDADMVFGSVDENGKVSVIDTHSIDLYGPHPPDVELGGTDDILEYAGSEFNGATYIEFSRPLETDDAHDHPITQSLGNKLIWAYSSSDDFDRPHKAAGANWTGARERERSGPPPGVFLRIHIFSMSLAFVIMAFIGYIARFMKGRKWWLKTHKVLGLIAAGLGVYGVGSAVFLVSFTTGIHIRVVHSYFGLVGAVVFIASPVIGFGFLKAKRERKPLYRKTHRWFGRLSLLLVVAAIILGLFQAGIL
ncbi:MAG: hypothetical protein JSV25_16445 [Spirochaetota bacterium]|nr:MAG: hypothetical protein JSV25_16445 [Spirochaetota bacterium]